MFRDELQGFVRTCGTSPNCQEVTLTGIYWLIRNVRFDFFKHLAQQSPFGQLFQYRFDTLWPFSGCIRSPPSVPVGSVLIRGLLLFCRSYRSPFGFIPVLSTGSPVRLSKLRWSGFRSVCSSLGRLEERVGSIQEKPRALILLGCTLVRRVRCDDGLQVGMERDSIV